MLDSNNKKNKYQLVHRALAGYTYYEVYQDQKLIGNIKMANVSGAPIRIRGIHEIDFICRNSIAKTKSGKLVHEVLDDQGTVRGIFFKYKEEYWLSITGEKDIKVTKSKEGYSCTLDGEKILHIDETIGNPYVWKNRLEGVDNIIGVRQILTHNIVSVKELLMVVAGMFVDFNMDEDVRIKKNRCYHCMNEFEYGYDICPHCGFDISEINTKSQALVHGVMLAGHYLVGEMFFAGGNYLSYYGWDENLKQKVIIREFFPKDKVRRLQGEKNIIVYPEEVYADYLHDLDCFMEDFYSVKKLSGFESVFSLIDGFEENLTGYLVFNTMDGVPLFDYIEKRSEKLSYEEVVQIAKALCEKVSIIHSWGYVFGDLNYKNIILLNEDELRLKPDVGYKYLFSRKIGNEITSWKQDMNRYIAPELYNEIVLVGPWIDVYSIGAVLYCIVCGHELPDAMEKLFSNKIKQELKSVSGIPEGLVDIIEHATESEYSERFYDAASLHKALSSLDIGIK